MRTDPTGRRRGIEIAGIGAYQYVQATPQHCDCGQELLIPEGYEVTCPACGRVLWIDVVDGKRMLAIREVPDAD